MMTTAVDEAGAPKTWARLRQSSCKKYFYYFQMAMAAWAPGFQKDIRHMYRVLEAILELDFVARLFAIQFDV
jgi:hypothetical protein